MVPAPWRSRRGRPLVNSNPCAHDCSNVRTRHRLAAFTRPRRYRLDRRSLSPEREPPRRVPGLLSWRRLAAEPFVCFLLLFAIMAAMMCIAAVHRTGMSRALLGNWADVRW